MTAKPKESATRLLVDLSRGQVITYLLEINQLWIIRGDDDRMIEQRLPRDECEAAARIVEYIGSDLAAMLLTAPMHSVLGRRSLKRVDGEWKPVSEERRSHLSQ